MPQSARVQSASVRPRADRPGYRAMPYFKTSTEWFEQSSLLLKARPASVRHNAPRRLQHDLTTSTDAHHLQVLSTQAHSLQDLQAREVRCETGGQACHDCSLLLSSTRPEARRADRDIHPQNVRRCLGNMSAVRDHQGCRSGPVSGLSGASGPWDGCIA
jgi:hypothetical protein